MGNPDISADTGPADRRGDLDGAVGQHVGSWSDTLSSQPIKAEQTDKSTTLLSSIRSEVTGQTVAPKSERQTGDREGHRFPEQKPQRGQGQGRATELGPRWGQV